MASIKLTGDTSGEITISAPAVAGTNTLTLPANTGTIVTSESGAGDLPSTIAGPAFSAYLSADQTGIVTDTWTKVTLDTEEFDTNSNYDNATNYRFTPTVAGYYQVSGQIEFSASRVRVSIAIYKNGSQFKQGTMPTNFESAGSGMASVVSALVYMNGTTDYVELYGWHNDSSSESFLANSGFTSYFQANLVRAA